MKTTTPVAPARQSDRPRPHSSCPVTPPRLPITGLHDPVRADNPYLHRSWHHDYPSRPIPRPVRPFRPDVPFLDLTRPTCPVDMPSQAQTGPVDSSNHVAPFLCGSHRQPMSSLFISRHADLSAPPAPTHIDLSNHAAFWSRPSGAYRLTSTSRPRSARHADTEETPDCTDPCGECSAAVVTGRCIRFAWLRGLAMGVRAKRDRALTVAAVRAGASRSCSHRWR